MNTVSSSISAAGLVGLPEARAAGIKKDAFVQAIERLLDAKKITAEGLRRQHHKRHRATARPSSLIRKSCTRTSSGVPFGRPEQSPFAATKPAMPPYPAAKASGAAAVPVRQERRDRLKAPANQSRVDHIRRLC